MQLLTKLVTWIKSEKGTSKKINIILLTYLSSLIIEDHIKTRYSYQIRKWTKNFKKVKGNLGKKI